MRCILVCLYYITCRFQDVNHTKIVKSGQKYNANLGIYDNQTVNGRRIVMTTFILSFVHDPLFTSSIKGNISSRFSRNSEAFASVFRENLE